MFSKDLLQHGNEVLLRLFRDKILQIYDKITKLCQNVNSLILVKNFEADTIGND